MNLKKIKNLALFAVAIATTVATSGTVLAAESETIIEKDSADNRFFAGDDVVLYDDTFLGGFGFGYDVTVSDIKARDSLAVAGYNVNVDNAMIGATTYVAGYNVGVKDSIIAGNMVAGGYIVTFDKGSSAASFIAAGNLVEMDGYIEAGTISADTVIIDGIVNGDLNITAREVTIGENAVVTGNFNIESELEPVISSSAKIEDFNWIETKPDSEVVQHSAVDKFVQGVKDAIYWAVAMVLAGLVMFWLMKKELDDAAAMVKERTVPMLVSGAVTLVALPVAVLIASITFVGLPTATLVLALYVVACCASVAFAAASLAPVVLNKMPALAASLIGIAVAEVARQIPFLGFLVGLAAIIYTLGYFIQSLYLNRIKK